MMERDLVRLGYWRQMGLLLTLLLSLLLPAPGASAADWSIAIAPSAREWVQDAVTGTVDSYQMDVALDVETSTLSGSLEVRFHNATPETLDDLAFRLFPNAAYYDEGALTTSDLRVDDRAAQPRLEEQGTVLIVPLPSPLEPGASTEVAMRFSTVVPRDSTGSYGIFSHDTDRGSWILADWYPILTGWEPGSGWRLDPPTPFGDPTFSEAALYDVTLTVPASLTAIGSGEASLEQEMGDLRQYRFTTGPVREFTLVLDDRLKTFSAQTAETIVRVHINADSGTERAAQLVLRSATAALREYGQRYGRYPYTELDLVETELAGALGVSWSGIIFLDTDGFLANPGFVETDPARLDFTIAHEVGHQWWGSMVGVNSNDHAFMNEGLTNALTLVAIADSQGQETAAAQLGVHVAGPYLAMLGQFGDAVVDLPADEHPPHYFGPLNYGKAALGFLAIRELIGDEAFFTALRAYAETYAFRIAEPGDLLAEFEAASGRDLLSVWTFWFESASVTERDVNRLVNALAA